MTNTVKQKVSPKRVKDHWSANEKVQDIAKNLVALGLTMTDVASIMGVDASTMRYARQKTPALQAAVDEGRAKLHDLLVAQMVLAATGYEYEESRTERRPDGSVVKFIIFNKRMPPNAQLFQFLMSNRWPESWKIKKELIAKQFVAKATIELEAGDIERFAGKLMGGNETKHTDIISGDNPKVDTGEHRVPQEVSQAAS